MTMVNSHFFVLSIVLSHLLVDHFVQGETACDGDCSSQSIDIEEDPNCKESDLDWKDLDESCRTYLESLGYYEACWDCDCEMEDLLEWDKLPLETQNKKRILGWTKEEWDNYDPCQFRHNTSQPELFHPFVLDIDIPDVLMMNLEYLGKFEYEMRFVSGGYSDTDNMDFMTETMPINEFAQRASANDPSLSQYNLHLEGAIREKNFLSEVVGERIIKYMREALSKTTTEESTKGNWKSAYNTLSESYFDWAMFSGVKGTVTHMHLDTDLFQFLYVVEGKKRVVVIPNDERTVEMYTPRKVGFSAWADVDVLEKTAPLPKYAEEFILTPGKGLFIPYLAWHAVENLETSVGYNLRIKE